MCGITRAAAVQGNQFADSMHTAQTWLGMVVGTVSCNKSLTIVLVHTLPSKDGMVSVLYTMSSTDGM